MITAVFDTETTGLLLPSSVPIAKQPKVIELAVALVEKGKVKARKTWLIQPECALTAEITRITGLTDEDLKGKPTFAKLFPEIKKTFAKADAVLAHNASFDLGMVNNDTLRAIQKPFPWPEICLCTVQEYKHLFGFNPSLKVLYERILGKPLAQTHRAMDDVNALLEILFHDGYFDRLEGK
jgi:DNA polymerase III epsilon subunit-like protein